jgi:flagellar basal body-associated protein FliL
MSKPRPKQLGNLPLIIGGILVAALLGFAFWRMTKKNEPPAPAAQTQTAPAVQQPIAADEEAAKALVTRISVADLQTRLANNQVTLIDVRDADSYLQAHIPGAMHIPLARIDGEIPYLPKDKPIVTYCT